jgi:radical SAM superfamily enzyme YgiQ (UPF0313 family)
MKILLILPYDRTYHYRGFFSVPISYAPLTLTTLAALVPPELDAEIDIVDEGVSPPRQDGRYDIVGITATASSSPRAYFLCAYWRARGAYVVMGGAHVTLMPDEAVQYADSVFIGLAEQTWPQFLRDYAARRAQARYQHQSNDGDLPVPVPRRDLLAQRGYMSIPTIIANRGCRLNCEFCAIHHQWGRHGLTRPVAEVIDEIRVLGAKRLIFLDPNLYSERDYTLALFEALTPLRLRWSGLATLNLVDDPPVFDALCRSGCEGLLLGLENFNQQTMRSIDKPFNRVDAYQRQISRLRERNIASLGCFVLGFDEDSENSIRDTLRQIPALGLDLVRFSVLTPLPGTGLHRQLAAQGRILTDDMSLYDNEHVVYRPKQIAPQRLQALLHEAWRESYRLGAIMRRALIRPQSRLLRLAANLGFRLYGRKLRHERLADFDPAHN